MPGSTRAPQRVCPPLPRETLTKCEGSIKMKAVTWHGKRDVRVDTVADPKIQRPTDAIVRITSTGDLRI